jgi:hypothetical protein
LCLALLQEAIGRAERWYACRERALAEFDLRGVDIVRRLRNAGAIAPSTTWDPHPDVNKARATPSLGWSA